MLRLGMMTRRRCQVVGLAVRRANPNLRMLMVVKLIDAMLPHSAATCPLSTARSGHLGAPHRLSRSSPLSRPRELTLTPRNSVLDPRDTRIIANRAATVVNEVRVLT